MLISEKVEYLIVGGYAVNYYGSPRATGDLDVWIAVNAETASRTAAALRRFGFSQATAKADLFLQPGKIVRMGTPPLRIEILTDIAGVDFAACYARRRRISIDDVEVSMIDLDDLITNKRAAGRAKDLADLRELDNRTGA